MSVLEAIVLGIIQGLTEFLPISSSGHLAIVNWIFGSIPDPDDFLTFNVLLHFASVAAILIALRREVFSLLTSRRHLIIPLIVGTIPAGVAGLVFKQYLSNLQYSMSAVGGALIFTGVMLAVSERLSRRTRSLSGVGAFDALAIGAAQAVALVPGVSRSGMTISGGLFRGLTREDCVRFSFLLAIPAILGATAVEARGLIGESPPAVQQDEIEPSVPHSESTPADPAQASTDALHSAADAQTKSLSVLPLITGGLTSFLFSLAAIKLLLGVVRKHSIAVFSYYCVPAGLLVVVLSVL